MVTGPPYSERRSCSAVRAAARPPPTMTMPPGVLTSEFYTMRVAICTQPCALPPSRQRPFDDVREHDDAFAAFDVGRGPDPFQRLFEMAHVAGEHVQDRVRRAGDGRRADHLRNVDPGGSQVVGGDGAVAEHLNIGLGGPPECVAVDDGGEAADHTA